KELGQSALRAKTALAVAFAFTTAAAEAEPEEETGAEESTPTTGDLLFSAPPSQQEAGTAEPLKLALSAEPGKAFTASFGNREISAELTRLLSDAKVPKAIHNYKAALRELQCRGVELAGMRDEPMLYSYLVNPTYPRHSLAEIALRSFNLM